jgi:hypothetical protein
MKIRTGFVSNSSSSSFIVGIAQIIDKAKFDNYIKENNIVLDDYDLYVTTADSEDHSYDVRKRGDRLVVENFCTEVSTELNKPGTMFFVVNVSNNEGDGDFWNEEYGEMNYDIDTDHFSDEHQAAYSAFFDPSSGLSMQNDITFGAERNG